MCVIAEVWSGKMYRKRKEKKTEKEKKRKGGKKKREENGKEKERRARQIRHITVHSTRTVLPIITVTKWHYLSKETTITRANEAQRLYPFKSNKFGNQQMKRSVSCGTYKSVSTYDSVVKGSS